MKGKLIASFPGVMHGLYFIAHSKPTKQKRFEFQKGISMITCVCLKTLAERHGGDCKAGESRGRAPEQASDYALRAPNPLDSSAMTRCFIKILGLPNQSGSQVFCPHVPPPSRRPWVVGQYPPCLQCNFTRPAILHVND